MNNMKNTFNRIAAIVTAITVIDLAATIIFLLRLPDNVPVHFNFDLVCDKIGSKWNGIIPSIIMLLIVPIFIITERNGKNIENNRKPFSITLILITFLMVGVNWFMLALMGSGAAIGDKMSIGFQWAIMLLVGFVLVTLGNYMPTVRQNKTLGIKLPWTLKNEKCWNLTHRFAGKLYVIGGLITIAMAMAMKIWKFDSSVFFIVYIAVIMPILIVIPFAYAYMHRND